MGQFKKHSPRAKKYQNTIGELWSRSCHSSKAEAGATQCYNSWYTGLARAWKRGVGSLCLMQSKRTIKWDFKSFVVRLPPSAQQQCLLGVRHPHCLHRAHSHLCRNLPWKGRKIKTCDDTKAVLHKGDKDCLLLEAALLQSDTNVSYVYLHANTLYLLMQSCSSWYPHTWLWSQLLKTFCTELDCGMVKKL